MKLRISRAVFRAPRGRESVRPPAGARNLPWWCAGSPYVRLRPGLYDPLPRSPGSLLDPRSATFRPPADMRGSNRAAPT